MSAPYSKPSRRRHEDEVRAKFSRRIRDRRAALKLSLSMVSKKTGGLLADGMVTSYESGRCGATIGGVVLLAGALECSTDYLLGLRDTP